MTLLVKEGGLRAALKILIEEYREEYREEICRHCSQVIGNSSWGKDLAQVVFVQAFRDLRSFSGRSSYRTWLYAIARNRCLDMLKATRRRRAREQSYYSALCGSVQPSSEQAVVAADTALAVQKVLQQLPAKTRVPLLLHYVENLSYKDISKICRERPSTLQARVTRALPRIRKQLAALGVVDA